jgi:AcrR family transcriptional regulator
VKDKTILKKKHILDAAMKCFIQYGYSKSTFKDIAEKAGISRASLYLYFKNKNDLFITMDREKQGGYEAKSREILKSNRPDKEKLAAIIDIWIVDPYRTITSTPYANGWLDELVHISKQSEISFRKLFIKSIAPLVGNATAEVIVLAIRGLMDDRPPVRILHKRISLLTRQML